MDFYVRSQASGRDNLSSNVWFPYDVSIQSHWRNLNVHREDVVIYLHAEREGEDFWMLGQQRCPLLNELRFEKKDIVTGKVDE